MNELGEQLRQILTEHGAVLVGYGDVSDLVTDGLHTGVSVGLPMPKELVRSIEQDVTEEYRQWYHAANGVLDEAIRAGGEFLRQAGYAGSTPRTRWSARRITAPNCPTNPWPSGLDWGGSAKAACW